MSILQARESPRDFPVNKESDHTARRSDFFWVLAFLCSRLKTATSLRLAGYLSLVGNIQLSRLRNGVQLRF